MIFDKTAPWIVVMTELRRRRADGVWELQMPGSSEWLAQDQRTSTWLDMQELAAERLRDSRCSHPFYAKRAMECVQGGKDEMVYWRHLQAGYVNSLLPPKKIESSTASEPYKTILPWSERPKIEQEWAEYLASL